MNIRKINIHILAVVISLALVEGSTAYANTEAVESLFTSKLFSNLPDSCPTPDAFAIAPDGALTLSCPNFANQNGSKPGTLLRLSPEGEVSSVGVLLDSNNQNNIRPMGLAYAPDGSLFIADNQGKNKGRLLRVTFVDGQIDKTEVVAKGMSSPNGLRYYDGALYLTQLQLPKVKGPHISSGIYRFNENDRNINVSSDGSSPNLIFLDQTQNVDRKFGLDGLVFDSKGALYATNLGDGIVYKLTLNLEGKVVAREIYATVHNSIGPDGMAIDSEGNLYLAGFITNQVIKIDTKRNVSVLAKYPDNDGSNGQLDQPADLIVYQEKLIISNFDLMKGKGITNKGHSKPYTISYIELN